MNPVEILLKLQALCRLALSQSSPAQLASRCLLAVMVLCYVRTRNRLLESPRKIGKIVKDGLILDESPEFDVIIIGGGMCVTFLKLIHLIRC